MPTASDLQHSKSNTCELTAGFDTYLYEGSQAHAYQLQSVLTD